MIDRVAVAVVVSCVVLTGSSRLVGAQEAAPELPSGGAVVVDEGSRASVRRREIETRARLLQERIFRTKARLRLLAERVLDRHIAGSKALIVHRDEMGASFRLVRAVYTLDGAPLASRSDDSTHLGGLGEIELFDGVVVPGEHTLSVHLEYVGQGHVLFPYMEGYRFKVWTSHTFTAAEGKVLKLRVTAYERGGPTTPMGERPDVRFIQKIEPLSGE
jgi:hypothetical protein